MQANADSARAAKNAAQTIGRRKAMDILLRRLTIEEDWIYLPRLACAKKLKLTPALIAASFPLTDADLIELESGFEVYNEKSSSNTYRAFITYRFKPDAVRRLLKTASIPYSEAQTRTALVLPVLQTQSGTYLWEENNPWMAAWKVRPYNNELTPMVAPLGDLEDAQLTSARGALNLNQTAMEQLAARYPVSQVIVAHAYLQQTGGEDKLRVRLINAYRESGELAQNNELGVTQGGGVDFNSGGLNQGPASSYGSARVGDVLSESWYSQPSGNFPALAERSIEGAIAKYAKSWKERTLIDHTVAALLQVSAYYRSLGEWTKIRSALVSTPLDWRCPGALALTARRGNAGAGLWRSGQADGCDGSAGSRLVDR